MGKKIVKVTETVEETAPVEKKEEEKKVEKGVEQDVELTEKNEKKVEKKEDEKVKDDGEGTGAKSKNEKKDAEPPALPAADDDDISFIKQALAKQMIDSLDVETLKKFIVECEGKSLKQKAAWIEKNKPVPTQDPAKGLPKGAPGGKPLTPYDPGYKHEFYKNPKYIG